MKRRSKAREVALQLLYQHDLNPAVRRPFVDQFVQERLDQQDLRVFCLSLYDGVMNDRAALDQQLESATHNWKLSRMTAVDRNVLRLGAFELRSGTEPAVVINEAVELAQRFGGVNSGAFVNGILDRIRKG